MRRRPLRTRVAHHLPPCGYDSQPRQPFVRDAVHDPGGASPSRIATAHVLPSTTGTASASTAFTLSGLTLRTPHDSCLRFERRVTATPARLGSDLPATALVGRDLHPQVSASFTGALPFVVELRVTDSQSPLRSHRTIEVTPSAPLILGGPIESPQMATLTPGAHWDPELLLRHQPCRCVSSPSASRRPRGCAKRSPASAPRSAVKDERDEDHPRSDDRNNPDDGNPTGRTDHNPLGEPRHPDRKACAQTCARKNRRRRRQRDRRARHPGRARSRPVRLRCVRSRRA